MQDLFSPQGIAFLIALTGISVLAGTSKSKFGSIFLLLVGIGFSALFASKHAPNQAIGFSYQIDSSVDCVSQAFISPDNQYLESRSQQQEIRANQATQITFSYSSIALQRIRLDPCDRAGEFKISNTRLHFHNGHEQTLPVEDWAPTQHISHFKLGQDGQSMHVSAEDNDPVLIYAAVIEQPWPYGDSRLIAQIALYALWMLLIYGLLKVRRNAKH